jgi:hypothetical protein
LTKIALKKKELLRLTTKIDTVLREASARMQPLTVEITRLDQQCHALFAELLARKRQSRRARTAVKEIYQTLQAAGLLSPRRAEEPLFGAAESEGGWDADPAWDAEPPRQPGGGGFSARRPGDGEASQSLRGLFRRLAMALHPDKVQLDEEKARRTELMKELTQAYKDGDLARLIELERMWAAGAEPTPQTGEIDRRCAALVQTNEALRAQLDQLMRELRELRRSPHAALLKDAERAARQSGQPPIDLMVAEAIEHSEKLAELLDFALAYRDGKMDLNEFLEGPPSMRDPGMPADVDEVLDGLLALSEALFSERRPRRKKRRGANQPPGWNDIPF